MSKMEDVYPLILDAFKEGLSFSFPILGTSMQPMLHTGDVVVLEKLTTCKKGDIVLFQRSDSSFVLHRIRKIKDNTYFIVGDHQTKLEPVLQQQLIGKVIQYKKKKKDKIYNLSNFRYKLYKCMVRFKIIRYLFSKLM